MLITLKNRNQCRKPLFVKMNFSLTEDTDNWDIIGYYDETYTTGYERKNFTKSWNLDITFDVTGHINSEYDPELLIYEPYVLDYSKLMAISDDVDKNGGNEQIKYFINPLRVVRTAYFNDTNSSNTVAPILTHYREREEIFDKEQSVIKWTEYHYFYIFNIVTGVRASRKITYTSTINYVSYH